MKSIQDILNNTTGRRPYIDPFKTMTDQAISLGTDGHDSFQYSKFLSDRYENNINTVSGKINLGISKEEFCRAISDTFVINEAGTRSHGTIAKSKENNIVLLIDENHNITKVTLTGDIEQVAFWTKELESKFPNNPCFIDWVYDPQYLESVTMPLSTDNMPMEEMYPFLDGESLGDYYNRFNHSNANILVLIGPPGTGKTTFIRGLLAYSRKSATLAYHHKIIEQDSFFVEWYNSDNDYMILEDSDSLLLPRKDGNDLMARFLNLGDGLMSIKNKKIIFSTNLPNVTDIDEALTRPGRCFDILEFGKLNEQQIEAVCDRAKIDIPEGDSLTISEVFASTKNEVKYRTKTRSKFGFI